MILIPGGLGEKEGSQDLADELEARIQRRPCQRRTAARSSSAETPSA